MITLLLPLASSDRLHAPHFLRLMQAFPPGPDTKALILPTPSAFHDPALSVVIDGLRELFQPENVRVEATQNDGGGNWSYNSACHFRHAMDTLYNLGEGWADRPTLWMEADLPPIVPNWDKLIDDDYKLAGTPFRGMLEKTRYIDQAYEIDPKTNAQKLVGPRAPRYDGSIHLVGAGMYPPNYVSYLGPNKSPMASYRSPSPNIPFDVKCQDQHKPATQSPLFLHKPRTVNWRRTEGNLFRCDDQTKDEFGLSYAGAVNLAGVALVHGVKDGSLADAILSGSPISTPAPKEPIEEDDLPSREFLHECFEYNPESGILTWKNRPSSHFSTAQGSISFNSSYAGEQAGCLQFYPDGSPHVVRVVMTILGKRKMFCAHRIIYKMMGLTVPDGMEIDHKDRNPHNNAISNLRVATPEQNCQNRKSPTVDGQERSLPKGVSLHKSGQYVAQITIDGKVTHLGLFDTPDDAHESYRAASLKNHGEFSIHAVAEEPSAEVIQPINQDVVVNMMREQIENLMEENKMLQQECQKLQTSLIVEKEDNDSIRAIMTKQGEELAALKAPSPTPSTEKKGKPKPRLQTA